MNGSVRKKPATEVYSEREREREREKTKFSAHVELES